MKSTRIYGFTLIELVITIVILSILAVTVAPKFIDLKNDSKTAVLQGVGAAMNSGLQLVHNKAVIENQLGPQTSTPAPKVTIAGVDIPLHNGYPAVNGNDSFVEVNAQIRAWIDIDMVDRNTMDSDPSYTVARFFSDKSSDKNILHIFFGEDYPDKSGTFKCRVQYTNDPKSNGQLPVVEIFTDAC